MTSKGVLTGLSLLFILAALAACGGGGGGGGGALTATPKAFGTATLIETDNASHAVSPRIAVDTNGNGTAVWTQSDGTRNNIWSNRFQ